MMDSYNASCYVENNDGQYHMECEINYDGKEIYSDYDGNNFVNGLNTIMDDLEAQIALIPEQEEEEEKSLEEQIICLTEKINQLQDEKKSLNEEIKKLKSNQQKQRKEEPIFNSNIFRVDTFNDFINEVIKNYAIKE